MILKLIGFVCECVLVLYENCLIFRWFYLMMVPWTAAFWCSATNMEYLSLNPDQSVSTVFFVTHSCERHSPRPREAAVCWLNGSAKHRIQPASFCKENCVGLRSSPHCLASALSAAASVLRWHVSVAVTEAQGPRA